MPNLALSAPQTVISKTFLNRVPSLVYLDSVTKTDTGSPSKAQAKQDYLVGKLLSEPYKSESTQSLRMESDSAGLQNAKSHVTPSSYKSVYLLTTHLFGELFEIVVYLKTLNVGKNTKSSSSLPEYS